MSCSDILILLAVTRAECPYVYIVYGYFSPERKTNKLQVVVQIVRFYAHFFFPDITVNIY